MPQAGPRLEWKGRSSRREPKGSAVEGAPGARCGEDPDYGAHRGPGVCLMSLADPCEQQGEEGRSMWAPARQEAWAKVIWRGASLAWPHRRKGASR